MADAKALALERVREGYQRPAPRTGILVGGEGVLAALEARRPPRVARRPHQRSRRRRRPRARQRSRRRRAAASDDGQRAVPARSRARGVSEAVRRTKDARADSAHAEDRQAVEELSRWNAARAHPGPPGPLGVHARDRRRACRSHFRVRDVFAARRHSIDDYAGPGRARARRAADRSRGHLRRVVRRPGRAPVCRDRRRARTSALVLVSTPGPGWHLRPRHRIVHALRRGCSARCSWRRRRGGFAPELPSALPDRRARWAFGARRCARLMTAPPPLSAMAARARLIERLDLCDADCARMTAPTLVVTGEPHTRSRRAGRRSSEYIRLIRGRARRRPRAHRSSRHDDAAGRVRRARPRVRRGQCPCVTPDQVA